MHIHVLDHALVAERLTRLRSVGTGPPEFRRVLRQLSRMLLYEATRNLRTDPTSVATPMGPAPGTVLSAVPVLVPVLRAGLGMLDAALDLLDGAPAAFVGLQRDEQTLQPRYYLDTIGADLGGQDALVLDPMLATGGSCVHTCELLRDRGVGHITVLCVLAAPEGVETLQRSGAAHALYVATVDTGLDDRGFILPGLGDAGDRQYGEVV